MKVLFSPTDRIGIKKSLSLKHTEDFLVEIFYGTEEEKTALYSFIISGAKDALKKDFKGTILSIKTSITFELSRSGVLSIKKTDGKIEEEVEETIKKLVPKNNTANATEEANPESEDTLLGDEQV